MTVVLSSKRTGMALYSGANDASSHGVRIVLEEKGIPYDLVLVDVENQPDALVEINPYNTVPTLADREVTIYNADIIMEYLDERYPHPSLMPVYPVARARTRLMLYRVNLDWYSLMNKISNKRSDPLIVDESRKALTESITSVGPMFKELPFFLSEEFSLVDCSLAPLLWRLPSLGIELPVEAKSIKEYAKRLFNKEAFQQSLTEVERMVGEF